MLKSFEGGAGEETSPKVSSPAAGGPLNPIHEYFSALFASERLGHQVAHHRVLPGQEAVYGEPRRSWTKAVTNMLRGTGIERLYSHQAEAVNYVRAGRHVCVATPTASGKTFTYNLPVLEDLHHDPFGKALYLFPLKALAQDQLRAFNELTAFLPDPRPTAGIYDGDTSPHFRKKYRENPPNVLLTNPEMVHLSMLPHHETWRKFWSGLRFVVVDEVHTYRGVMGSHMAMVFRRLRRICELYGADPTFIFCSATVGNPAELCSMLTGLDVHPVTKSGGSSGDKHVVFLNPLEGPAQAAIQLLQAALARNLRTIVYTQSRKLTELVALWASERSGPFKDLISAYRAGFLPEERREIEARMSSGELLAVISTSALELGIDIGGLDLCILVGYPGTVMQTLQRGGRVGRKNQESGVVLVAQEDALDQYFMRHPEDFFARPPESAMLNPHNPVIMARHLVCAAAEHTMRDSDFLLREEPVRAFAEVLISEGTLFRLDATDEIVTTRKRPHREVDLRGAGRSLLIEDVDTGANIGTVDEHKAYRETHTGAVYLHRGQTYVVRELDLEARVVRAGRGKVKYYTRARGSKDTEILSIDDSRTVRGTRFWRGRLRVTETITGYERRNVRGNTLLGIMPLELPPLVFETEGIWFEIPAEVRKAAEDEFYHFMGGIHALEHAAIGILPLMIMTDRNDLGGISTPYHPQVDGSAVFIYDGMPGGAGLTRLAFERAEEMLETTLRAVVECPCELGCPSCVHSPKCGSGNRPIDKGSAVYVLSQILGTDCPERIRGKEIEVSENNGQFGLPGVDLPQEKTAPKRYGVLDIETRYGADEVGGWSRCDRMGVSIAVLYDSGLDQFLTFEQDQMDELVAALQPLDLVIGFNILRFDYKVLSGLHGFPFHKLPTLDLLQHVHERLGYRLKLDTIAQATLDVGKSADGLQALAWWKEGRLDLITEYCIQDVAVTRDVYLFGRENGYVLFTNKAGQKVRLPVDW